jgi:hypothetical protein
MIGFRTPLTASARASGRGEMTWVLVALWVAMGCIALAMVIGIVDEVRRPASNIRRTGVGIGFVASFASLWLLVTPLSPQVGLDCGAPLLVLTEFADPPIAHPALCSAPMRLNVAVGLMAALVTPALVLITRGRED